MANALLIQVWDFTKKTKMAYPDWDGPQGSTGTKGFCAETLSPCRHTARQSKE